MEKIKLEFESPKVLNELKQAKESEKKVWRYAGIEGSILTLDTSDWFITCAENGKSAKINEWQVDETNYTMKVKTDEIEGVFTDLDYTFSVSMLGQMVSRSSLLNYLKQLQDVYYLKSGDVPQEEESPNDDLSKGNETNSNNEA